MTNLFDPVDATPAAPVPSRTLGRESSVLAAVALGGGIGAAARYAAAQLWPGAAGAFPTTTMAVNVIGCALLGALMVAVTEVRGVHRLIRPFLGTGVLGGFTTFSTWTLDIHDLLATGHIGVAAAYLTATLTAALAAVAVAAWATRRLITRRRR